MIISTERKFIFYHLRKCGGSSVERSYERVSLWNDLILGSTKFGELCQGYYHKRFGIHKHSTPDQVTKLEMPFPYEKFETVALIRNPFRMYESLYRWTKRHFERQSKQVESFRDELLSGKIQQDYARWPEFQALARSDDFIGFMDYMIAHCPKRFNSFHNFLQLNRQIPGVKHVLCLEDMDDGWQQLEDIFGCRLQRIHYNATSFEPVLWSGEHISFIEETHREDLDCYGYSHELNSSA